MAEAEALPRLVLASASTARRRLLAAAGVPHVVDPHDVDEAKVKRACAGSATPGPAAAEALAERKAVAVSRRHPGALVLGADQILECDGRLFDKPADRAAAGETLRRLRGRAHTLIAALAVARDGNCVWRRTARVRLRMRDFSDRFLEHYLDRSGPEILESVGAYRLEGDGVQLFADVGDDYFATLGLPLLPLLEFLRAQEVMPR